MKGTCPICEGNEYSFVYEKLPLFPGASIVKCNNCNHVFTVLAPGTDPGNLYSNKEYQLSDNRNSIFDKILSWEYKRVIKRINTLKNGKGALLDFGSGKGKFANLAKKNGWQVKGVETAVARAEYARKIYGIDVSTGFYEQGKIFINDFDVITLFHVLEHLPKPVKLLTELIKHNMAHGGIVVIEVPNMKSWQARIAGKNWMHLDAYRHINHFIPAQLVQIGKEAGLKVIRTGYYSFHLGVLGMTDSFLKFFGYRKSIIYELKNKNILLMIMVCLLLPFALALEIFAALIHKGGINRGYFKKISSG